MQSPKPTWIVSSASLVSVDSLKTRKTTFIKLLIVTTARQSCELLLETISALLDFSKLEAHAVKLNKAPIYPVDLVADCLELLQTLASQKGLELTYDVTPDVPLCIDADGPRIRQVLQNLIGNALKVMALAPFYQNLPHTVSTSLPRRELLMFT
jgi:signal transduction histidine kinase